MDGVLANLEKRVLELDPSFDYSDSDGYEARSAVLDQICKANPTIFQDLEPIEGGIEAVKKLNEVYDIYFLSTPMWALPESFSGKRIWLEKHFGDLVKHKLILTKRKDLNIGDYLIDDTTRNGAAEFTGEHIHFGTEEYPTWKEVLNKLL